MHTAPVLFFCNSRYRTQNPGEERKQPPFSDVWGMTSTSTLLAIATENDG